MLGNHNNIHTFDLPRTMLRCPSGDRVEGEKLVGVYASTIEGSLLVIY